jgi:hypothetical protein
MKEGAPLRLPDFIAVGPPRTGTTWLDRVLRGHVGLPAGVKETQFFIWRYSLGIKWYATHFRDCPANVPAGEVAPTYFAPPEVRDRIALHIPRCRIICTLRDPVDRLYSHYKMWRRIGVIKASFEYVAAYHRELLAHTRYAFNVRAWQEKFGRENVLVMIHEDLRVDRQEYINRLCAFIGIAPIDLSAIPWERERVREVRDAPKSHRLARRALHLRTIVGRYRLYRLAHMLVPVFDRWAGGGHEYPPLGPEMEARLRECLRPEIEELEELIQRDLSTWKQIVGAKPTTAANPSRPRDRLALLRT